MNDKEALCELMDLRERLFAAIDRAIERDGHHKSYEGTLELLMPCRFGGKWTIELHCYVIGPWRHSEWHNEDLGKLVAEVRETVDDWIAESDGLEV